MQYKAGRKPTPEELRPQFPIIREILTAMGVTLCEMEGYEADDLLGTAARLANERGVHAYVLTGDRDSLQLVNARHAGDPHQNGHIRKPAAYARHGEGNRTVITPAQVPDMKGLMGDSSDHIPGVPGVGEKTALKLIEQYGTLEEVLAHAEEIPGKLGERIRENREAGGAQQGSGHHPRHRADFSRFCRMRAGRHGQRRARPAKIPAQPPFPAADSAVSRSETAERRTRRTRRDRRAAPHQPQPGIDASAPPKPTRRAGCRRRYRWSAAGLPRNAAELSGAQEPGNGYHRSRR